METRSGMERMTAQDRTRRAHRAAAAAAAVSNSLRQRRGPQPSERRQRIAPQAPWARRRAVTLSCSLTLVQVVTNTQIACGLAGGRGRPACRGCQLFHLARDCRRILPRRFAQADRPRIMTVLRRERAGRLRIDICPAVVCNTPKPAFCFGSDVVSQVRLASIRLCLRLRQFLCHHVSGPDRVSHYRRPNLRRRTCGTGELPPAGCRCTVRSDV